MNVKIIYHSMTGNTKKVALAISEALDVPAEDIAQAGIKEEVDLLFFGDGIYAGKPDKKTVEFMKSLDKNLIKNAVVFGTFGGQNKAIKAMQESLKGMGINVLDESFGCRGKAWVFINRKHPDQQELNAAKEFALNIVNKVSGT